MDSQGSGSDPRLDVILSTLVQMQTRVLAIEESLQRVEEFLGGLDFRTECNTRRIDSMLRPPIHLVESSRAQDASEQDAENATADAEEAELENRLSECQRSKLAFERRRLESIRASRAARPKIQR